MLINEGGLIRAIKRAYKAGGYTVLNTGNDVAIYTDHWFVMANRALLPRKVLATIICEIMARRGKSETRPAWRNTCNRWFLFSVRSGGFCGQTEPCG